MKLSIITINKNNATGLRKTMESVFSQTYRDFEYIVVDGASSDESVDVIKTFALQAEGMDFKWISESDAGIYNAMNKGLRMSHGEYTLMLNSGDYFVNERVIDCIMPELDGTDIVQGNNIENHNGVCYRNRGYGRSNIDIFDVIKGLFLHQASFCRRDLFERYGFFDESYAIAGDTKFFITCLGVHDSSFKYVNIDICNYDCNGLSAPLNGQWNPRGKLEYNRILNELFSVRMQEQFVINEKKVRFYDKMHQCKWIWWIMMLLARLNNVIYGEETDRIQYEKIDNR